MIHEKNVTPRSIPCTSEPLEDHEKESMETTKEEPLTGNMPHNTARKGYVKMREESFGYHERILRYHELGRYKLGLESRTR
jgi:hypothetical protein